MKSWQIEEGWKNREGGPISPSLSLRAGALLRCCDNRASLSFGDGLHSESDIPRAVKLGRYLTQLGYGTRREIGWLLEVGRIQLADGTVLTDAERTAPAHASLRVLGEPLDPPPDSVIMLHKPAGYVCSTEDRNPLVYNLMPSRFTRRTPIMSAVGRLDRDTTGVLLLTDNGQLLHRLTSPKSHVPRTYRAQLAEPMREDTASVFASGALMLDGETKPLAPARVEAIDPLTARVELTEGRYHQVRRMFAAVGNHVRDLHREQFGPLTLGALAPGEWRVLSANECDALEHALRGARAAARDR